jgi:hypothetical protein
MDEVFDFGNKFFDAAEGAPADGLLRDDVEPDFHLVEPGRVGRRDRLNTPPTSILASNAGWQRFIHLDILLEADYPHLECLLKKKNNELNCCRAL